MPALLQCYIWALQRYKWWYKFDICRYFLKKLGFYELRKDQKWGNLGNFVTAM